MDLEALAVARAAEQMEHGTWREDERHSAATKPVPPQPYDGRLCLRCHTVRLTARNHSNLCISCFRNSTPFQRGCYASGHSPPRRKPLMRASRRTIEFARVRLAARGIAA